MKISIITVVYNAEVWLEQTLLSIINQTYKNIEFIVIDGDSTDGTLDIINKYIDNISYWVSEKDEGIYDAMNKGIAVATGDWAYFLGAGDILLNVLDKVVPMLKNSNTVYYGDVYMTDILKTFAGKFSKFQSSRICICHQAIIYPITAVKKYPYNLKYRVQGDHYLNMQLNGDRNYQFSYIPVILCVYQGNGFSTQIVDKVFQDDRLKIVKQHYPYYMYIGAYLIDRLARLMQRGPYKRILIKNDT